LTTRVGFSFRSKIFCLSILLAGLISAVSYFPNNNIVEVKYWAHALANSNSSNTAMNSEMIKSSDGSGIRNTHETKNVIEYKNSIFGIQISYPSGWQKREYEIVPRNNNTIVEFIAPRVNHENVSASTSLFLVPLTGSNMTAAHHTSTSTLTNNTSNDSDTSSPRLRHLINESLNNIINDSQIHGIEKTFLKDNVDAYNVTYTITTKHNIFEKMQIWTIKNGQVYVFTYTALPTEYQKYLAPVLAMIKSFSVR
jgi:hypothetical protein